jgi:sec-independent protein translocase protein TatA
MLSVPAGFFIQQLAGIGGVEWLFIFIVVLVLFFGVKKIPEIAKSFGRATTEYEKARIQARHELEQVQHQNNKTNNNAAVSEVDRKMLESVAEVFNIDVTGKSDDELRAAIDSEISKKKQRV